jgi:hypothetical protein
MRICVEYEKDGKKEKAEVDTHCGYAQAADIVVRLERELGLKVSNWWLEPVHGIIKD